MPRTTAAGTLVVVAPDALRTQNSSTRTTCTGKNGKRSTEAVNLICSILMLDSQPEQVAAWMQGRWVIENKLHRARSVTYDEDRHQLQTFGGRG